MIFAPPRKRVSFLPAWDRRDDPGGNFGVHGLEIRLALIEIDWAIELLIMTPWVLPKTREWWNTLPGLKPRECVTAAVHLRGGRGSCSVGPGGCPIFPLDACSAVDISSFTGDPLFAVLVAEGEEPFWLAMQAKLTAIKERERAEASA